MIKIHLRDRLLWGLFIAGGVRAYHVNKLFLWTPPGYSRKKYRDLLGRLRREGYLQRVLVNRQVHFRLTGSGKRLLESFYPILKLKSDEWDGFWRMVMFEVPENRRKVRDKLRRKLKSFGFGYLQDSNYISPFEFDKALLEFIDAQALGDKVLLVEAKQKHLGKPGKLAKSVWSLDNLVFEYQNVIDQLGSRFGIKEKDKRDNFLRKMHENYLKILLKEPFLPKELLFDSWPADQAKKYILRTEMLNKSI